MPMRRIADAWMETHNVRTIRFDFRDEPQQFKAGQFLTLGDNFRGYKRPVRRAYSIASSPLQQEYLDLTIKREVPGLFSTHITELPVGYELDVTGPTGKYCYEPSMGTKLLLLGAGSGITPLHSIARFVLESNLPDADVVLFFSVKTPRDIIYKEIWEKLQADFPNFHFYLTVTRASASEWSGHRGRITADWVRECIGDASDRLAYICGPGPMVETSEQLCLELGMPNDRIHTEKW